MPTEKPRLTAYPDLDLYEKLEQYRKKHRFKTLSKAVVAVLTEYFSMVETPEKQTLVEIKQEIKQMQKKLEELNQKVESLEKEALKEEE